MLSSLNGAIFSCNTIAVHIYTWEKSPSIHSIWGKTRSDWFTYYGILRKISLGGVDTTRRRVDATRSPIKKQVEVRTR